MTLRQMQHRKSKFLEHFKANGNILRAAEHAVVDRSTIYRWQEHDELFAAAFREAEIAATETLEAEAWRRAVHGDHRLKFDRRGDPLMNPETGEFYREQERSDTLLIFLLKARAPAKYRERLGLEHSGPDGGPIQTEDVGLSDKVRAERIQAIIDRARARATEST